MDTVDGEKDFRDHDLLHSVTEENLAARVYRVRAQYAREHGDITTADLYEHIAKEEEDHERELKARFNQVDLINRRLFQNRIRLIATEISNRIGRW